MNEKGELLIGTKLATRYRRSWGEPGRYRGLQWTQVGDPSGRNRDAMLMGWFKWLRKGAKAEVPDEQGKPKELTVGKCVIKPAPDVTTKDRILTLQWMIEKARLDINATTQRIDERSVPMAERLAICLENYRWPTDETGTRTGGAKPKPVHDEFSHAVTALEFGVTFLFGVRRFLGAGIS